MIITKGKTAPRTYYVGKAGTGKVRGGLYISPDQKKWYRLSDKTSHFYQHASEMIGYPLRDIEEGESVSFQTPCRICPQEFPDEKPRGNY